MWTHWWSSSVVLVTCTVTMTIVSCLPQILLKMFAFPLLCCLGVGGMSAGSLVFIHQFVHYLLSFTTVNSKYSLIFCLLACIKYCIWRLGVLSQYLCWPVKTDLKVCCWKVIIHLMLPVCSPGRSPVPGVACSCWGVHPVSPQLSQLTEVNWHNYCTFLLLGVV